MLRYSYSEYIENKIACEKARDNGEFCLSDWTKKRLIKAVTQAIESMELNQEYKYLTPITIAIKGRGLKTLEDFAKDLNKKYKLSELRNYLLKFTAVYKTGSMLRHTRFYKMTDHKGIMDFVTSYYTLPKPVQKKLNLELE